MIKIKIENITHTFALPGKKKLAALEGINLEINRGEFIALIGESGCGKSTLLNLTAGLLKPTSGSIQVDDKPVTGPHYSRAMMFQHPCLLPWLTVEDNIGFGCNIRGEKDGLREKIAGFIESIGLKGFEKAYPSALSEGMRQRVALARSLIGKPEILLLDECFSDIDVFNRTRLLNLILDLWKKLELSVIHVTHDIEEALLMAQRIVLLGGRPGTTREIFPVDLPYPRDPSYDLALNKIKNDILERFNE